MHRTLFIILAVLLTVRYSIAQQAAVKIDYDYISRKIVFPPLLQQLTKEDKYSWDMTEKLTFHRTQEDVLQNVWNPMTAYVNIKARVNNLKPTYTFEIYTDGVENLDSSGVR